MRTHYDFSNGVRGKYAGKVDTTDVRRIATAEPASGQAGTIRKALGYALKDEILVELRPEGGYAIRRCGSDRPSAVEATQAAAIAKARELGNGTILIERVRNTSNGLRDKWRRA